VSAAREYQQQEKKQQLEVEQQKIREGQEKFSIEGINTKSNELNAYEMDFIDRMSYAFYHARKAHPIDLNASEKLSLLFKTVPPAGLKLMSKKILSNFIQTPVKRVITFAKLIPDFRSLRMDDQSCLLLGSALEIFICSSSTLYDKNANKLTNVISKDRHIEGNNGSQIQLEIMRLVWSEEVFERTIRFLRSMGELELDEATVMLVLPLILFAPDRRELNERRRVYQLQAKYAHILKKYLYWKHAGDESRQAHADKLYSQLLLKLVELRNLSEMHANILLDAEPAELESLPKAFILNQKDEFNKLNSAKINLANPATVDNCCDHIKDTTKDVKDKDKDMPVSSSSSSSFSSTSTPYSYSYSYSSDFSIANSQPMSNMSIMSNASLLDHAAQRSSSDYFSATSSSVPSTPASSFHIPSVSMDSD
jgi:hypothetical protein